MGPWHWALSRSPPTVARPSPRAAICALLGVALNQGLFLEGLARSTPMNGGLIMTLIPVFTFAIAAAVKQEHLSWLRALGVLTALAGVALLLLGGGEGPLRGHGFGNFLMVLNGLSYATYLVVAKQLVGRYRSLVVIAWVYILALPYLPHFMTGEKLTPDPGNTSAWWSMVYVLAFPTVLAYLLNMFALARVRATTTAVYIYLQPLVAGIGAWFAFGERLTADMGIAAVCLFVGIWLVARRRRDPIISRAVNAAADLPQPAVPSSCGRSPRRAPEDRC